MSVFIKLKQCLYNLCVGWGVISNNNIDFEKKYNELMTKIGDFIIFNQEDIEFLNTLPNDKLIYIIKIYNKSYIETIKDLLE
jgi:hypothetical protein